LDGQPSVTGALVDIRLHIEQFIEDIGGFAEDGVM
jgi:hypothetical protein